MDTQTGASDVPEDAPRGDVGKVDAAKADAMRADAGRADAMRADGPGVRLLEELHRVLDTLRTAAADPDPVEMVHDARKAMKEYRALLRLVPGERARAARRQTAEVARALSGARDRAAAAEALDILEAGGLVIACDAGDARAVIGSDAPQPGETGGHRAALGGFLVAAREALAGELGADAAAADVGAGLRKAYRKARRAAMDTPEHLHETRKGVVTHRYQMSFLEGAFGRGGKRARKAQRLRDLLGAHQDIEILRPMLHAAAPPLAEGALERLDLAMNRAQKRLRKKARRAHGALFRRRPSRFAARYRKALAHD